MEGKSKGLVAMRTDVAWLVKTREGKKTGKRKQGLAWGNKDN